MTSADLAFRPAMTRDAATVAAFGERVFRDTFAPHNRAEDMDAYCRGAFALAQVERELQDPDRHTVLATMDGQLVGYAQLRTTTAPACVIGDAPLEIVRFYVDRPWHGRGTAQALMAYVIDAAQARGARALYLAVWDQNHRAAAFYAKHGFTRVGCVPFVLGGDRQTDDVMVRSLAANAVGHERRTGWQ